MKVLPFVLRLRLGPGMTLALVAVLGIGTIAVGRSIFMARARPALEAAYYSGCVMNRRSIEGTYWEFVANASNEVSDPELPPVDYPNLVKLMVPRYIGSEPKCASAGIYSIRWAGDDMVLLCSVHGQLPADMEMKIEEYPPRQ